MTGYSTTDTLSSLVDEVIMSLQGFGVEVDQVATLLNAIDGTANVLRLDAPDAITRGIVEIDDEVIYVSSALNGVATVPAWGRGFKGTAASSHSSGAAVFISPTYPRSVVTREVNNTIRALYPDLFAVRTYDFTADSIHAQYMMPSDMDRIMAVEWRWLAIDGWNVLNEWELVQNAYAGDFSTGKVLALGATLGSGIKVHVTYAAPPALLANATDRFADVSGLPATCRDVVVFGAASRLLPWIDSGRLPTDTVSSDQQDQTKPIGNAVNVGREIRTMYQTALLREKHALNLRYPMRKHRIR
jgi:hypothetical protein